MKTALLLVDVIHDFFHPRGTNYHSEYQPVLQNIIRIVEAAREQGLMIVHAMEAHHPGHCGDFEWRKLPEHCLAGSFDAEPVAAVGIRAGEFVLTKRRYSAFFATELDLLLREAGIEQLLVAGVKSHVCIRATIQDAFGYGYRAVLVREATGSKYQHLHAASLEDIERYMGDVVDMKTGLEIIRTAQTDQE